MLFRAHLSPFLQLNFGKYIQTCIHKNFLKTNHLFYYIHIYCNKFNKFLQVDIHPWQIICSVILGQTRVYVILSISCMGTCSTLEEGVASHSSILAWRTPWTEEPGGLQSMGVAKSQTLLKRLRMHWLKWLSTHTSSNLFLFLLNLLLKYLFLFLCIYLVFYCVLVPQSCLTLCEPMDCSLPGSSVHGICQARILEWVAISFSRGSSRPRDQTWVFCIAGRFFTIWATRETLHLIIFIHYLND